MSERTAKVFCVVWIALGIFFGVVLRGGGPIMIALVVGVTLGGLIAAGRAVRGPGMIECRGCHKPIHQSVSRCPNCGTPVGRAA
jgi:hypothetical protein